MLATGSAQKGIAAMEPSLDWLVAYEVDASKRYRRFLSIVLIKPAESSAALLTGVLSSAFRGSDRIIPVNGVTAVVMSETSREGGLVAVERCREMLSASALQFGIATFPMDGHDTELLIEAAYNRLLSQQDGLGAEDAS